MGNPTAMKSKDVIIVGAGMAGLLAARMLKHRNPVVIEKAGQLPNNHSAVLRFRSEIVGDVLGIPFKKVRMMKSAAHDGNIIAASMIYAHKCSGVYRSDRSLPVGTEVGDRFIAPSDLISRMAEGIDVRYGMGMEEAIEASDDNVIISTIPMPSLMDILALDHPNGLARPNFQSVSGANISIKINDCDAYVSVYDARRWSPVSRISITGDKLIIELPNLDNDAINGIKTDSKLAGNIIRDCLNLVGCDRKSVEGNQAVISTQRYAKIQPVDQDDRHSFIHWATDNHNIYSLGRFATWRPNLLLDDLVNDIRLIDKWSSKGNKYAVNNHR